MGERRTATPEWFHRAILAKPETCRVEVAGCSIHYLRWGDVKKPGLLLVAGTGGHAHWFSHVAPLFADQFHVVSIDIAGSGDSGRRERYSHELIVEEIMAVCADSGMLAAATPPTLVGHSVGGQHVVRAAIARGESLLGVIAVDALRYGELAHDHAIKALAGPRPTPRPARLYADYDSAVARFRLSPPPETEIEATYVLDHIARHSVARVDGGWTWKFDMALTSITTLGLELKDALRNLACRSAAIYGETTHLADHTLLPALTAVTGGRTSVFVIPGSSHYPMIDNPLAFLAAIKGIALTWIANGCPM